MNNYTISKLALLFGLSRSTLLYYDRIGLLSPSGRTASNYRIYTEGDRKRLERIFNLRQAGLSLEDIKTILASEDEPSTVVLERRLQAVGEEILDLKSKQKLLSSMLKGIATQAEQPKVSKRLWVEMLRAAGMDEQGMERWHAEFEHRAPEGHHEFLLSLGITEQEVRLIRHWSSKTKSTSRSISGGSDSDVN